VFNHKHALKNITSDNRSRKILNTTSFKAPFTTIFLNPVEKGIEGFKHLNAGIKIIMAKLKRESPGGLDGRQS
jgi:hypothetical protein